MSVDCTHYASGKALTSFVRAAMSYQEKWLKREYNGFNMCVISIGTFFIVDVLRKVPLTSLFLCLLSPCKDVFKQYQVHKP